jgi:hypothetical protein
VLRRLVIGSVTSRKMSGQLCSCFLPIRASVYSSVKLLPQLGEILAVVDDFVEVIAVPKHMLDHAMCLMKCLETFTSLPDAAYLFLCLIQF